MTIVETLDNVPPGYKVEIVYDEHAESPRESSYDGDLIGALTVPSRDYVDVPGAGRLEPHWRRLLDRYGWRTAVTIMERYASVHGIVTHEHSHGRSGYAVLWYMLPEHAAEFGDPLAALKATADEYEAWAQGEAYGYVISRAVPWSRDDNPDEHMGTWETIESVWGFLGPGYDHVEEEARSMLAGIIAD